MAYKKTGTATLDPVNFGDPKSILFKAGAAAARLKLFSADNSGTFNVLEFDMECPAHDMKFIVRSGALADRFPCSTLQATITGDSDTFTRIDG